MSGWWDARAKAEYGRLEALGVCGRLCSTLERHHITTADSGMTPALLSSTAAFLEALGLLQRLQLAEVTYFSEEVHRVVEELIRRPHRTTSHIQSSGPQTNAVHQTAEEGLQLVHLPMRKSNVASINLTIGIHRLLRYCGQRVHIGRLWVMSNNIRLDYILIWMCSAITHPPLNMAMTDC